MNERILELAQNAGLISHFNAAPHRPDIERFAELIVRECASQCLLTPIDHALLGEVHANRIKQHFGVK